MEYDSLQKALVAIGAGIGAWIARAARRHIVRSGDKRHAVERERQLLEHYDRRETDLRAEYARREADCRLECARREAALQREIDLLRAKWYEAEQRETTQKVANASLDKELQSCQREIERLHGLLDSRGWQG